MTMILGKFSHPLLRMTCLVLYLTCIAVLVGTSINNGGEEYAERAASQQLFLDFLDVPSDSPRRTQQSGVYGSYLYGEKPNRVRVILLDTRYAAFCRPLVLQHKLLRVACLVCAEGMSARSPIGPTAIFWVKSSGSGCRRSS
jgi:hypothetical protein